MCTLATNFGILSQAMVDIDNRTTHIEVHTHGQNDPHANFISNLVSQLQTHITGGTQQDAAQVPALLFTPMARANYRNMLSASVAST